MINETVNYNYVLSFRHSGALPEVGIADKKHRIARLLLWCGFLFLFFISFGCTRYKVKNVDSFGEEIICFGNSITAGLSVFEGGSYPYFLSEMLGHPVINAGRSGDTSSNGLRRLEEDVLTYQPRLVIIEFGGNDYLRKIALSQTINNIRMMTERIQSKGSMVALVDISSAVIMKEYRKHYKKLAYQTQAIFIPALLKGIITNPSLKSDQLHPNVEGNRIIAEKIYRAIKPYLEQKDLN